MQKRKGFTLVELVIVIAVIAILAGVLIGTFASVIKRANDSAQLQKTKSEEIAQKAEDIIKKIEDSNWYGWEDFENDIVAKITEAYSERTGDSLTEEQIKKAVTEAVEEYAKSSANDKTDLTEEQVKAIVENALGSLKYEGVTEAQVRAIVKTATSELTATQLTAAQVRSIVNAANANNLTAADVANIISQANLAKTGDVNDAVTTIVTKLGELESEIPTSKDFRDAIIELLPVTVHTTAAGSDPDADVDSFVYYIKKLNSGSTIIIDEALAGADLVIDQTLGDKVITIKGADLHSLTIDAPEATIYLLNNVEEVNVVAVDKNSLHIKGQVQTLVANSGRVVLEEGAVVNDLTAAPSQSAWVTIQVEEGAEIRNKLEAQYQKHDAGTYDYIEIVNKGEINVTNLTATSGTNAVTTNVVITNEQEKSANAGDPSKDTLNVVSQLTDEEVGLVVDDVSYVVVVQENTSVVKPNTDPIPVENGVAKIGSVIFDDVYSALERVPFDGTETLITIIGDCGITSNAGYIVNVKQNIVLDLNGHTVSSVAGLASTSALIFNYGTLRIKDSTDTTKDGSGTGRLTTVASAPDMQDVPGYASNTITNLGNLTIESGIIDNKGAGYACFAVDNQTNSNLYTPVLTISGGKMLQESAYHYAVRMFCNSTTKVNKCIINGGVIEGGYAFWMQYPNSSANKSELVINGGTFIARDGASLYSGNPGKNVENVVIKISGGDFQGSGVKLSAGCNHNEISVTGGKFAGFVIGSGQTNSFISGGTFPSSFVNTWGYVFLEGDTVYSEDADYNKSDVYDAPWDSKAYWESQGYWFEPYPNADDYYVYHNVSFEDFMADFLNNVQVVDNGDGTITVVPNN